MLVTQTAKEVIVQRLMDAMAEVEDAEKRVKLAKEQLKKTIQDVGEELNDHEAREDVAWELYWKHEEISATLIKEAFADVELTSAVFTMPCRDCGQEIKVEVTSRTQFKQVMQGDSVYDPTMRERVYLDKCMPCREKRKRENDARVAEFNERQEQTKARLEQLRTMPYQEYLQTPEWQARRMAHMKSTHFRCQVCNGQGTLNVHHRTYERRGCEQFRDLIVLCQNCHGIFHREGRLAK